MNRYISAFVALLALVTMLLIWPIALVTRDLDIGSGMGEAFSHTEPIGKDGYVTQVFQPAYETIKEIKLAFSLDQYVTDTDGNVVFELYTEDDEVVLRTNISVKEIVNHTYYTIPVDRKVKKNTAMYYRLTVDESLAGMVAVDYNTTPENRMPEMIQLYSNMNEYEGASICQITYQTSLDAKNVVVLWLAVVLVALALESLLKPKTQE